MVKKLFSLWGVGALAIICLIFVIFVLCPIVVGGQETLEAEIKNGQVVIYKTTKIQTEIIPLPSEELGISDEDIKKVCLTKEKKITVTEEIDKKINFFSFPFAKTKTILQKEISNDIQHGWQSRVINQKQISEKSWLLTLANFVLFGFFIFLSWSAWRNKRVGSLFKSYFFIALSCLFFVAYANSSLTTWVIAITFMLGLFFGVTAYASMNFARTDFFTAIGGLVSIALVILLVMVIMTAKYNSAPEFMAMLLFMITISCFIGWLMSLGKINIKLEKDSNCPLHK
ncbi:MAG: hypothetical protein ABIG87_02265 [Patescibacteria group bacterium]